MTTIQQERTDIAVLIEELTRFATRRRSSRRIRYGLKPGMSYQFLTAYKQGQEFA
jgi:hypothetical protein